MGSGVWTGSGALGRFSASVSVGVLFEVTGGSAAYELSGQLALTGVARGSAVLSQASVAELFRVDGGSLARAGALGPGTYFFQLGGQATNYGGGSGDVGDFMVDAAFRVTPAP